MQKLKIKPGDLIAIGSNTALVTRETKKYFYYNLNSHPCKISKEKIYFFIDTRPEVSVIYSRNLKYRRMLKKMRTLDLHGVTHKEAENKIRDFLNFVELPCRVIPGNSEKMKEIVVAILHEYEYSFNYSSDYNLGSLVIYEK